MISPRLEVDMPAEAQHDGLSAEAPEYAMPDPDAVQGNKATARVMIVLSSFTAEHPIWGVSELSRELSMTKNMVYRALSTLLRHGLVVRSKDSNAYEIGPRAIAFARRSTTNTTVSSVAEPFLGLLASATGETVSLAVRNGRNTVTVAGVRGRGVIARRVPVGRIAPMHATVAGRAILAFVSDADRDKFLAGSLERVTGDTIVKPAVLRRHLQDVRRDGYSLTVGDNVPLSVGYGIAFPIFDREGEVFGSVTVAGPASRFDNEVVRALMPSIRSRVDELNRRTALYSASEMGLEES
jgi:DNA-binding IclR family transcriptional regulator